MLQFYYFINIAITIMKINSKIFSPYTCIDYSYISELYYKHIILDGIKDLNNKQNKI